MTETTTEQTDRRTEEWIYAGMRLNPKGERRELWLAPGGGEHSYKFKAGKVIGGRYEVSVDDQLSLYGEPKYFGTIDDQERRAKFHAANRAAEVELELVRRKRADKQDDQLNAAIDHVADLIASTPYGLRPGMIAFVNYRLNTRAWR